METEPEAQILSLKEAQKKAVLAASEACAGNITQTAQKLGIDRNTLYRKLKEYKIDVPF